MKVNVKRKFKTFYKRFRATITRSDMMLLPGQLAFFLVLAIIPTITLVSYFASKLNLSMDFMYEFLTQAFSSDIADILLSTSSTLSSGLSLAIVMFFAYYISSNGAESIIITSNTIYGIKDDGWLKRRGKAILMILLFTLIIIVLLLVPMFGNAIINLIKQVNLNQKVTDSIVTVFDYLKSPLMYVILFLIIKAIYVMAPSKKIKGHNANYGALFTTVSWIITTYVYSFYVNRIADLTPLYGKLTTLCVLMIWFYFLAYLFVLGLGLNYQKEIDEENDRK